QTAALDALDARHRAKARVIFQSAPALAPGHPRRTTFDVIFVGHMRAEKDPLTPMRALQRLPASSRLRLVQVGDALEAKYAQAARELEAMSSRYQWLRALPHAATRQRIRHSRALLISSVMEGGANVVVEAVTCGVPVIASRISGNIGMLGKDYEAYFTAGDDRELARLLERISVDSAFLARLRMQCAARAPLFEPARERSEVDRLVDDALRAATRPSTAESTACAARS
ncbi:MAG TPA: glycosyltransferase, partial [Casimicrobiaceae bacterium]|nr:glycosyltransferase [Casimicrobiaceae bacterium]